MGLFSKGPKDITAQWLPQTDPDWEEQKKRFLSQKTPFRPMKSVRVGGVSVMVISLTKAPRDSLVVAVSVSNFDPKALGLNKGAFGLLVGGKAHRCKKLKVQKGNVEYTRTKDWQGKDVGFLDAVVEQFQSSTFTAYFDAPSLNEDFAILVEAKRIAASHLVILIPYAKSEFDLYA